MLANTTGYHYQISRVNIRFTRLIFVFVHYFTHSPILSSSSSSSLCVSVSVSVTFSFSFSQWRRKNRECHNLSNDILTLFFHYHHHPNHLDIFLAANFCLQPRLSLHHHHHLWQCHCLWYHCFWAYTENPMLPKQPNYFSPTQYLLWSHLRWPRLLLRPQVRWLQSNMLGH